jgi:phytoene synthase
LPEALLEGLAWDAEGGRRYEDLPALEAYAARVAGSVGCMMAVLMGVRDRAALARACDLGVAMQLTNIARDVGEDARAGRLYLPLRWLREAGVDGDEWLVRPVFDPAVAGVVRRLLLAADELYRRAGAGIAALPSDAGPESAPPGLLYAGIGREVERRGLRLGQRTGARARLAQGRSAAAGCVVGGRRSVLRSRGACRAAPCGDSLPRGRGCRCCAASSRRSRAAGPRGACGLGYRPLRPAGAPRPRSGGCGAGG